MKHLSYRSGNPALNSKAFTSVPNRRGAELNDVMTIKGTVDKTAMGLFLDLLLTLIYNLEMVLETIQVLPLLHVLTDQLSAMA